MSETKGNRFLRFIARRLRPVVAEALAQAPTQRRGGEMVYVAGKGMVYVSSREVTQ